MKALKQYYERLSPASGRPVILDPFQSTFCALLGYEALLRRNVDDTNAHRLFLDRIFPLTAAGNGIQNNNAGLAGIQQPPPWFRNFDFVNCTIVVPDTHVHPILREFGFPLKEIKGQSNTLALFPLSDGQLNRSATKVFACDGKPRDALSNSSSRSADRRKAACTNLV